MIKYIILLTSICFLSSCSCKINKTETVQFSETSTDTVKGISTSSNQAVLANIARNETNVEIREIAVKKLTNQSVLANIARNETNVEIRKIAVKKLTNQSVLANVARNETNIEIRKIAVEKLK